MNLRFLIAFGNPIIPKSAGRVEIPKDNGKTRPLSIYCYEDKLVQEALRRMLKAVFEPHFYDKMMDITITTESLTILRAWVDFYMRSTAVCSTG